MKAIEDYVGSLGLDAYLVGGAVRDELLGLDSKDADFLVPGLDTEGLRAALSPHGRVDDLVVAGRPVGLRLFPRSSELRALAPAGIEFAPPRRERSTGPGRHDFEIVVDPDATVEDDLARRDFTVNAIARATRRPHARRPVPRPRTTSRTACCAPSRRGASPRIRCGSCAGCASSRSSASSPTRRRCAQMHEEASSVQLVSGERIGGGLAADGMGELSKLLLGRGPRKALALARDTGVLVALLPEFEPAIGFDQESRYHDLTVDEHTFAVVQAAADVGMPLRVRLAALFHDLGKPHVGWRGKRRPPALLRAARPPRPRGRRRGARRRRSSAPALSDRPARAGRPHRPRSTCSTSARRTRCTRGGCSRASARASRSTCSTTRRPTCSARARTARANLHELERLRALPRRSSSRSGRARTASPTWPSTAPT